ncbi:MAG: bifunctional 3-deoxy-7-phosphoheptulonate synthase/chorismate mutase type II [Salibacteraceae bacterium]
MKGWITSMTNPYIIAGPCSAESEQQVWETARVLSADERISCMRAGVWKPRTRPKSFEGMGSVALPWLASAQRAFSLPVMVEVARAAHIEEALRHNINRFWVGARTTVNPFSVQELADALRGADVEVYVKNPLNPDLQLWIGAIERFQSSGISKIAAIHRGFSTYETGIYRNTPNWEIPVELKTTMPELPIITDPSHIAGQRHLVMHVAQQALDLGFDGLMVETHPAPESALSDPLQQLPLAELSEWLNQLTVRNPTFQDEATLEELEQLRRKIDEIDRKLIDQLCERLQIVERIGQYKAEHNVAIFQLMRWIEIFNDRMAQGELKGIPNELISKIWQAIHTASLKLQTEVVHSNSHGE